jgi:hypothetical protein
MNPPKITVQKPDQTKHMSPEKINSKVAACSLSQNVNASASI